MSAVPGPLRECCRCSSIRSARDFHGKGRLCSTCRDADAAPKVTEAQWQATLVAALRTFEWHTNHTRRAIGAQGKWTTPTSAIGYPDLVSIRGAHLLAIEVKTDVGKATDEQLEWLARFSRLAGGRAWIVRPSDPPWDTLVAWLRDPATAPRRHGW